MSSVEVRSELRCSSLDGKCSQSEVHWLGEPVGSARVGIEVGVALALGLFSSEVLLALLLADELSVLDVDSFLVDVALLVVGTQLLLGVPLHEDDFVAGSDRDVVVEFLDLFVGELVEEVDDESAGHLIDLNPGGMHLLEISDAAGIVTVNLVELLRLNDVEAEVVVSPGGFSLSCGLHRFGC